MKNNNNNIDINNICRIFGYLDLFMIHTIAQNISQRWKDAYSIVVPNNFFRYSWFQIFCQEYSKFKLKLTIDSNHQNDDNQEPWIHRMMLDICLVGTIEQFIWFRGRYFRIKNLPWIVYSRFLKYCIKGNNPELFFYLENQQHIRSIDTLLFECIYRKNKDFAYYLINRYGNRIKKLNQLKLIGEIYDCNIF